MPKVGKKHYPYTKSGKKAAKRAAQKKGVPVKYAKKRGSSYSA